MKKVEVTVFGTSAVAVCDCGGACGPSKPMVEEAEDLKHVLIDKYGEAIDCTYVDVESEEMKGYPQIAALLDKVRLPLTCLNGEPSFHGGFSPDMVSDQIGKLLA